MTRRRCGGDFTAHARERERGAARGGDLTGSCGGCCGVRNGIAENNTDKLAN